LEQLPVSKLPSGTDQEITDVMMDSLSGAESIIVSKHSALIQHQATPERRNGPCILVEMQLEKKFSTWLLDIISMKFYWKRHSALQWGWTRDFAFQKI